MFRLFPHGGVVYVFSWHAGTKKQRICNGWVLPNSSFIKEYIYIYIIYIPGTGTYILRNVWNGQRSDLPRNILFFGSVSPFKNVEFDCNKEMSHPARGYHPICWMTTGFQIYIYIFHA